MASKRAATVSKKYQKKSHLQHIKERPDTYIGSCGARTDEMWVLDGSRMHIFYIFVHHFLHV
jgi:DNA topoisomerase-2